MGQAQPNTHQKMAASIHGIFAQGQGIQVSSAQAETVVEMKLWLAAIANGQLRITDTAQPVTPDLPPKIPEGANDGAPTN